MQNFQLEQSLNDVEFITSNGKLLKNIDEIIDYFFDNISKEHVLELTKIIIDDLDLKNVFDLDKKVLAQEIYKYIDKHELHDIIGYNKKYILEHKEEEYTKNLPNQIFDAKK